MYADKQVCIETDITVLKSVFSFCKNPMVGATVACAVAVEEAMK